MPRRRDAAEKTPRVQRGLALVQALKEKIDQEGILQKEAAAILGISEQHLSDVLTASRWSGTLSERTLRNIAIFLNVPLVSVYMLAEILTSNDFLCENTVDSRVNMVFEHMRKDPSIVGSVPSEDDWAQSPISVRLFAAILYEQLVQADLLGRAKLLEISVSDTPEG